MSDYKSGPTDDSMQSHGNAGGCGPADEPADQPKAPSGECKPSPTTEPPVLSGPEKCPPPPCSCPKGPSTPANCLEDLIKVQTKEISEAKQAETFKAALEELQKTAAEAQIKYTNAEYERLVKEWKRLDDRVVEVIHDVVCKFTCWWCLIECHIAPMLYEIREHKLKLDGGGKLYGDVKSLHDLRYWHERNLSAKKADFLRVKGVLTAWQGPAETIDKVLKANDNFIKSELDLKAADAAKFVYDVFLRLVPMHLAIAPPVDPARPELTTGIDLQYTQFSECDVGVHDDCCGPDVGAPTLRQQLIGPQPYLVHPDQYFKIICCLTKERYLPAKNALARAESDLEQVDGEIKSYEAYIEEKMKPDNFGKDAWAALTKQQPIRCDDYKLPEKHRRSPRP